MASLHRKFFGSSKPNFCPALLKEMAQKIKHLECLPLGAGLEWFWKNKVVVTRNAATPMQTPYNRQTAVPSHYSCISPMCTSIGTTKTAAP